MALQLGKLIRKTFESEDGEFHLYTLYCPGGKFETAVFYGTDAPPPRKTVEYQLSGEWITHPRYGREFEIRTYQKTGQPGHRGESREMVTNIKRLKETPMKNDTYYAHDHETIRKHERDLFLEQVVDVVDKHVVEVEEELNNTPVDELDALVKNQIRSTATDVLDVIDNGGSGQGYFLIERNDNLRMIPTDEVGYQAHNTPEHMKVGLDIAEPGGLAKEMFERLYNDDPDDEEPEELEDDSEEE